jgi:hypothetical protein
MTKPTTMYLYTYSLGTYNGRNHISYSICKTKKEAIKTGGNNSTIYKAILTEIGKIEITKPTKSFKTTK